MGQVEKSMKDVCDIVQIMLTLLEVKNYQKLEVTQHSGTYFKVYVDEEYFGLFDIARRTFVD